MRGVKRGLLGLLVVILAVGFYFGYRTIWGKPLTFNTLLDRQATFFLLERPQLLSSVGIIEGGFLDRHSGKLDAYSLDERAKGYAELRANEAEIRQWNRAELSPQEQLSYDVALWTYDGQLAAEKFSWLGANGALYPVNQAFGEQKDLPNFLMSQHQLTNAKLARNYVARLRALAAVLDAIDADVARQAKAGVVPPDFIIDRSVDQMKALIASKPEDNPLVATLKTKTAKLPDLSADEKTALYADAAAAVKDSVYPAYTRLIARMQDLRKSASHDAGLWRLKGGAAYYAAQLKALTTTDLTPEEIHQYGLSEVARITTQMDTILKSVGMTEGSVGERMDKLATDPRFSFQNTDEDRERMLARYKEILGHVKTLLPRYFGRVPSQPLDVRRVPAYAEQGSAGAYYEQPSMDGGRPGIFFANLRNVGETPSWAMPTLAYHEGLPGHHLQIATAMSIDDLPFLRRFSFFPAFSEGWALYAENLASDMDLYKGDPYGDLGRLQAELFRAVRLVVDTGMHAKHWSREQAIDYFRKTTGMAETDVTAEVERYVVWPGQACSYKIGMKTILALREKAKAALGARFDLKAFHTVVLENGAMPLTLLEANVERWIAERKGGKSGA